MGPDHAAALVGPCLTLIARDEPAFAIRRESSRWIDELLAAYPQKGGVIIVVQANVAPPSEEGRDHIDRSYAEYSRGVVAGAMVIEGEGFVSASIRSVVSRLMLRSKYNYPIKAFAHVTEGAAFLASSLPEASRASASFITSGVEELRAAYEGEYGRFTAGSPSVSL
ncbi:MAG TPA: hypothetical protein VFS00_14305 [Polyangiaceae bacterium]|nr:hypothetical protein [Polyangiaceae bacterium]